MYVKVQVTMTVEWLPISLPYEVSTTAETGTGARSIRCERDSNLGLKTTSQAPEQAQRLPDGVPGTPVHETDLQVRDALGQRGILRGYFPSGTQTSADPFRVRGKVFGSASELQIFHGDGPVVSLFEWFDNLPHRVWPRITVWTAAQTTRTRGLDISLSKPGGPGSSRDYAELELGLPTLSRIRFGAVSPEFLANKTEAQRPGFIQYTKGLEGMPDPQLRHSIRRALEFLFGCGFTVLGQTSVNEGGGLVASVALSAYLPGGSSTAEPPALLHPEWRDAINETWVASFVRGYLAKIDASFDLNRAVWLFLHARSAPVDMAGGFLGAAFEILSRGYFEQPGTAERSKLLPRAEWTTLRLEMEALLEKAAGDRVKLDKIKNRLSNLNAESGTQQHLNFVEDLGFSDSKDAIRQAIAARNDAAHGNFIEDTQWRATYIGGKKLQTLFARALLALTGSEMKYFDYSAVGFPVKDLKIAQG